MAKKNKLIVCKEVPVPPFLRHPLLDPAWPPFLKSLCPLPSVLFQPPLRYFRQSPCPTQIFTALIWLTNLSWFKQISKGQIYQLSCHFLSKINFNLSNPSTDIGYFNLWDIFRFIFRQLRMTFFHKIMLAEKNNFSSNA